MGAIQRVIQFIEYKKISKYKFYQETGLSNGFLDKGENMGSDKCEKIIYTYPEINPEWLLTGQGPMLKEDAPKQPEVKSEPHQAAPDSDLYYKMYKEEKAENRELIEEIGALKQQVRTLECENRILRQDKSKLERVVEMIEGTKNSSSKVKYYTDEDEMEKEEASFLPEEKL